jgi:hypothetical protein
MPIIRAKNEMVVISLALIEDDRLSWSARGVMAYIEAQPDGFDIDRFSGIRALHNEISELVAFDYLVDDASLDCGFE